MWGVDLKEVDFVVTDTKKIVNILKNNEKAREEFKLGRGYYIQIKEYYKNWLKFTHYTYDLPKSIFFYRVRKINSKDTAGYNSINELKYPPDNKSPLGRCSNNHSLNTMYTSFHELTAISECRLKENDYFQLTKFRATEKTKCFELGAIADIYLNTPRDSDIYKNKIKEIFNNDVTDRYVRGIASLEIALMDVFLAFQDNENITYLLSSLLADCAFSMDQNIEAIVFPSIQNSQRYGVNVAFSKKKADTLSVECTFVNKITKSYDAGFCDYITLSECLSPKGDPLVYTSAEPDWGTARYR